MVRTTNPGHRQRLREALAGDRGAATLQNTIIAPVLLLVLAVFLHLGIILHANNLAHAAATSAYNASGTDGSTAGLAVLNQSGSPISGASVAVDRGANTVTVTVTGNAPSFVPGLTTNIDVTVTGPTERWVN